MTLIGELERMIHTSNLSEHDKAVLKLAQEKIGDIEGDILAEMVSVDYTTPQEDDHYRHYMEGMK